MHIGFKNPYEVTPSYSYWAPWMGKQVRSNDVVLNTEHRKCHKVEDAEELGHLEVSEERLIELLYGNKVMDIYVSMI